MWPFRPKPRPVGPGTTDWQAGDVAECIDANWHPIHLAISGARAPQVGEKRIVARVQRALDVTGQTIGFGLFFIGDGRWGYDCTAFRKIVIIDNGVDRKVAKRSMVPA